jgi:nucleotide-binding universal stress UspA family protein
MLTVRQILCPIDFSDLSYEALRVAARLAARFHAHLDILHVVATAQPANHLGIAHNDARQADKTVLASEPETPATASRGLQKIAAERVTLDHKIVPRSLARIGTPFDEIVNAATKEGADLIVMGTHGLTGWRHMVLGSVAETVVRTAPCPVLAIREAREGVTFCAEEPRKILCTTDFSEASYEGLNVAGDLAREFGAEVVLVNSVEPFTGYPGLILEPVDIETFTIADATQELETVLKAHAPKGVQVRPLAVWGSAADGITDAALREKVDLIVIATHGVTGWRHLVMGSVAERVVQTAHCPVLTVPILRPNQVRAATVQTAVGTESH